MPQFIKVRFVDSKTKTRYWGLFNVDVIDAVHEATPQTTVIKIRGFKEIYTCETVDQINEKIQSVCVQQVRPVATGNDSKLPEGSNRNYDRGHNINRTE